MHSAATLNAGDVIMVGNMNTQDILNTLHVFYEGNNGSCTGNEVSVRFIYISIQIACWRTLQSRDDWNTCHIGLPTNPKK